MSLMGKENKMDKLTKKENNTKEILRDIFLFGGVSLAAGYLGLASMTHEFSPKKQIQEYIRIEAEKMQEKSRETMINQKYESIFEKENPQSFQDSVDLYQKYGLPIKLLNPSFEQKKEAVNKLEMEALK